MVGDVPDGPSVARLDLNLLVALDALLTERSVTLAARRLRLSQPALSASLARLRVHFNDPILARRGNAYELTPHAEHLVDQTTAALAAARRVFETQAAWSPATAVREFSLYGSDYAFATVAPIASRLAAEEAPGIRFRFMQITPAITEEGEQRLRSVDGFLMPHGFLSGVNHTDLWSDEWSIVAATSNERAARGVSMELLAESPWVFIHQLRSSFTSATLQLQQLGIEPNVEVVVEGFLSMPHFISGTDRLGLVQAGLREVIERTADVRMVTPPFDATPLRNALWWHPTHQPDPQHAWMRDLFQRAGAMLSPRA